MRKVKNGLRAKDLITAGIFTMLFFIVVFIFAMALSAVPVASLFITCADALAGGVIFLYLAMKVRKFGAVAIMSAIIGLIMCLVGHFWPCIIFGIVFGLAADFLCSRGEYREFSWNAAGYAAFILGLTLDGYTPMLLFTDAFIETRTQMGLPSEMIKTLIDLTHGPLMIAVFAGAVLCAIIGAFTGRALLKKHFEKSGVL
jgi:energy-coupling factor transport system substrate-specific component